MDLINDYQKPKIDILKDLTGIFLVNKGQLPVYSGVYFVYFENLVLYIGQASNLRIRWVRHHRYSQIIYSMPKAKISWLSDYQIEQLFPNLTLKQVEKLYIKWEKPILNYTGKEYVKKSNPRRIVDLHVKRDKEFLQECKLTVKDISLYLNISEKSIRLWRKQIEDLLNIPICIVCREGNSKKLLFSLKGQSMLEDWKFRLSTDEFLQKYQNFGILSVAS